MLKIRNFFLPIYNPFKVILLLRYYNVHFTEFKNKTIVPTMITLQDNIFYLSKELLQYILL